jgi:hypothetical protein
MRIAALGLRLLSGAAEYSVKRTGVGASDIAANIHIAAHELTK